MSLLYYHFFIWPLMGLSQKWNNNNLSLLMWSDRMSSVWFDHGRPQRVKDETLWYIYCLYASVCALQKYLHGSNFCVLEIKMAAWAVMRSAISGSTWARTPAAVKEASRSVETQQAERSRTAELFNVSIGLVCSFSPVVRSSDRSCWNQVSQQGFAANWAEPI